MAFHSKGGNISRSSRTNRRDKESILGLSGWLFADLLLAIAVIFLVVQDPAKPKSAGDGTSTTTSTSTTIPAENVGLIADLQQQLFVTVSNGARIVSRDAWARTLSSSKTQIYLGEQNRKSRTSTTWTNLKAEGYRVGFIMWFAKTNDRSKATSNSGISNLVTFLLDKGLIDDEQIIKGDTSRFPHIPDYADGSLGANDLGFRIFLFKRA
jgi:hypothetical protein